jgi:hypothetical protein
MRNGVRGRRRAIRSISVGVLEGEITADLVGRGQ